MSLVCQVVQTVRPDVKHQDDDMDIRQFVHIKKVSSPTVCCCQELMGQVSGDLKGAVTVCLVNSTNRALGAHYRK